MKHFATLLSVAALACGVIAQEAEDNECANMCINRGIDVGIDLGCRNDRDLKCLCAEPEVIETGMECVYAECDQEGIDWAIDYALEICEYAGVPITIETGRPTTGAEPTPAPEPTAEATEEPEAPVEPEEPEAPVEPEEPEAPVEEEEPEAPVEEEEPEEIEEPEEPEVPEPTGRSCRGN